MKRLIGLLFVVLCLVAWSRSTIRVIVLDENNHPMTGVKLKELKNEITTFTDFNGISELNNVADTKVFLVEYIGYESGYIKVSPNSDTEIKIVLRKK